MTTPSLRQFFLKNGGIRYGRDIEIDLDDKASVWIRSIRAMKYEPGYCK